MSGKKNKQFGTVITRLINRENLQRNEARECFSEVLLNEQTEMQQGAFLAALTAKGVSTQEIAGVWEAIYDLDTVKIAPETLEPLVENCGTGMDSLKTFNISTSAALIAAAAGIKMVKHGSRAITSSCGTIDILEELGVDVECDPYIVKRSIEKAGIGIFNGMSPKVHPQALGRILSQISFGTVLNIAASLANPAMPQYAVRGVYDRDLVEPVAQVMKEIGYRRALVVYGASRNGSKGMDEASTLGETVVAELDENGEILVYSFMPEDMGFRVPEEDSLAPSSSRAEEALRFIAVISGKEEGARADIICLNAGLILYLMRLSASIQEGCKQAREIIFSGRALQKLVDWVLEQNAEPELGIAKLKRLLALAGV